MAMRFSKMHGAGNDFVLFDLRDGQPEPQAAQVRAMADRHVGIGFDQLLLIDDSPLPDCVARYRICNSDGSPAQQCGNGARCIAAWLVRDGATRETGFLLDSPAGVIAVDCLADGRYRLDMGVPQFSPERIPLLGVDGEQAQYTFPVGDTLLSFGAVSIGNPHALILVPDVAAAAVTVAATALQDSGCFPQGVNVGFAQVVSSGEIKLRVHERGAGETLACGSGACAAVAVLVRQGRVGRHVNVQLPGGTLEIDWPYDRASLRMAGPATFVFEGEWLA